MTVEEYLHRKYNYMECGAEIPVEFVFEETLLNDSPTIRRKMVAMLGRKQCPYFLTKNDFVAVCILLIGCI